MARIGVFGGTFDPVHNGHLTVVHNALQHLNLNKIYFIPAGSPPHKTKTICASAVQRLAMIRLAIEESDRLEIWENEITRSGFSYTVDTLNMLQAEHPGSEINFIIGSDNLTEIPLWHKYEEILSLAKLCVTHRPGASMEIPQQLSNARIITFPSPELDISSTVIRKNIAAGISCKDILPGVVADYIEQNRLYR